MNLWAYPEKASMNIVGLQPCNVDRHIFTLRVTHNL